MNTIVRKGLWSAALAALLCASPALAADLGRPVYTKAPPAPAPLPPPFSWTGFYIGANIGGAWVNGTVVDNFTGANFDFNNSGFIGGGQIGFNYQTGSSWLFGVPWVFGAEWDIDGTTIRRTTNSVDTQFGVLQGKLNTDWITTLTGHLGLAYDRWLWYAKGGGAWVQESATLNNLTTGRSVGNSTTLDGWTAGVGVEWAFAPQWSAKLEYDYIGLSNWSPSTSNVFVNDFLTVHSHVQEVKVGVNWHGWGGGWGGY
jgi:outer membrane immunogenic protein